MTEVEKVYKIDSERVGVINIPLSDVITKTHPELPPIVLHDTLGILSSLMPYMTSNPEQAKMFLRGGTFRNFYYHNTVYDDAFYNMWHMEDFDPGEAVDFATHVRDHLASQIMDVDIRLNERDVSVIDGHVIRPIDAIIPSIIDTYMREHNWVQTGAEVFDGNSQQIELEREDYIVQISSFLIGDTEKRPHFTVTYLNKNDRSLILEIGLADIARSPIEKAEDIRYLNNGTSAETILTGDIWEKDDMRIPLEERLMMSYFNEREDDWELGILEQQVRQGIICPHPDFLDHYPESLITVVRSMDWFIGHWWAASAYWRGEPLESSLERISKWMGFGLARMKVKGIEKLDQQTLEISARAQIPKIKELALPLMSDMLFLISANPYLGMIMARSSGILDSVNLGQVIPSMNRLKEWFIEIGKITGYRFPDEEEQDIFQYDMPRLHDWFRAYCLDTKNPYDILIEALQNIPYKEEEITKLREVGLYPPNMPRTLTSLLTLLLPIGLRLEDVLN